MIYLITLNPAIDKYIYVDEFRLNITNFSFQKNSIFGGKAINVGKVVNEFTKDYEIITTIDENNEEFIKKETNNLNIKFFKTSHIRENLKINDNSNITEINEKVEKLNPLVLNNIKEYLIENVKEEDIVLFAGSTDQEDVKEIVNICSLLKNVKIIIDSASFTLEDLKQIKPYMIKPNDEEIMKLFPNILDYKVGAQQLVDFGIENVIITLGGKGSYYKNKNCEMTAVGIKGNVVNTVGAGDSYVGGFIIGTSKKYDIPKTLKLASACGSATAFNKTIAKKEEIEKLVEQVIID